MQTQEFLNLKYEHTRQPECFGRTIIAFPLHGMPAITLLNRVKDVWSTVASWGTWRDEELGEWPTDDECEKMLPDWFRADSKFSLQAWISDLHDRDWIWLSGSVLNEFVKIDLDSQSLPISTWMLEAVIESSDGIIFFQDSWISDNFAIALVAQCNWRQ
ncbi:MAG: hypothetical protein R3B84_05540 [Zavarzinella sp.]